MFWKDLKLSALALAGSFWLQCSPAAFAEGTIHHTYPMPRKVVAADPLNINLGVQVPIGSERYQFVTAPSKFIGSDEISVYYIDSSRRKSKIGSIPPGTEVKLTSIAAIGRTIYYEIPWTGTGSTKTAWVSGYNLKASSFNPAVK